MEESKNIKKFFWISAGIACLAFAIMCLEITAMCIVEFF